MRLRKRFWRRGVTLSQRYRAAYAAPLNRAAHAARLERAKCEDAAQNVEVGRRRTLDYMPLGAVGIGGAAGAAGTAGGDGATARSAALTAPNAAA